MSLVVAMPFEVRGDIRGEAYLVPRLLRDLPGQRPASAQSSRWLQLQTHVCPSCRENVARRELVTHPFPIFTPTIGKSQMGDISSFTGGWRDNVLSGYDKP